MRVNLDLKFFLRCQNETMHDLNKQYGQGTVPASISAPRELLTRLQKVQIKDLIAARGHI